MQESTKTKTFVGGAALMVVAAAVSHFANQPRVADDFAQVGEPFFEEFQSSDQATSLEVVAVDPETIDRKRFKVAKVDGLWRIPSNENYPAEASARLATTASSIIGIERESLAGRGKKDFDRLGVVDPLDEEIEDPETVGQRITLKGENDETLADYIIGKQVEDVVVAAEDRPFGSGENKQTYFYVRRADEQQTYIVPLMIDLSTKFSDWIDPDLLRFDTSALSQVTVRNYSLEEQASGNPLIPQRALVKKVGDTLELTKPDSGTWTLAGVVDEKETFDAAPVTEMIGVLDELRIADVRRKSTFQGKQLLTPDLKLNEDPEFRKTPQEFNSAIERLLAELEDKGFNLAGTQQQLELVSDNGEIEFGTTEGMQYTLHIGAPFEEDAGEIKVAGSVDSKDTETGSESDDDSADDANPDADKSKLGESEEGELAKADDSEEEAKSRYMLIRVAFDQSLLTDQPEEPFAPAVPEKPEGYTAPPEPKEDSSNADADDAAKKSESDDENADAAADEKSDEEKEASEDTDKDADSADTPARPAEFEAYDVAMEEFEQAKVDYELALTRFKDDKERFAERVKEAEALQSELNERFRDWYYVISGENLKALQVDREKLVTQKEPPAAPDGQEEKELPNRPDISFEGGPDQESEPDQAAAGSSDAADATESSEPESEAPASEAVEGSEMKANVEEQMATPDSETSETEVLESEPAVPVTETPEVETPVPAVDDSGAIPVPKPPTTPPAAE